MVFAVFAVKPGRPPWSPSHASSLTSWSSLHPRQRAIPSSSAVGSGRGNLEILAQRLQRALYPQGTGEPWKASKQERAVVRASLCEDASGSQWRRGRQVGGGGPAGTGLHRLHQWPPPVFQLPCHHCHQLGHSALNVPSVTACCPHDVTEVST